MCSTPRHQTPRAPHDRNPRSQNAWADCGHCGKPPSKLPADAIEYHLGPAARSALLNASDWWPAPDTTARCIPQDGDRHKRGTAAWFADYYTLLWAYVLPNIVFNVSATAAFDPNEPQWLEDGFSGWKVGPDLSAASDADCVVVSRMLLS
jgi:hypothetical protein